MTSAQQAPNVSLVETGGAFGPGMTATIRGIGQADFDPAFAPGVGIYIDDVYYTSLTGSNFSLLDLDRVEILRGPQGTLSGANSEGGSIKLYSVKPQGNDTGSVKVSYGQRNLIEVQAMADVSLINDSLFMRVSGLTHQQDGYVTRIDYGCAFPTSGIAAVGGLQQDCIAGKEGGKNYSGGRVALRWLPAENFEANLTAISPSTSRETAADHAAGGQSRRRWLSRQISTPVFRRAMRRAWPTTIVSCRPIRSSAMRRSVPRVWREILIASRRIPTTRTGART